MPGADEQTITHRPCEDCGGVVVAGVEPITADAEPELCASGVSVVGSEWCTNLACPSNHAVRGFHRIGVNDYVCKLCGEVQHTPFAAVVAHRRTH